MSLSTQEVLAAGTFHSCEGRFDLYEMPNGDPYAVRCRCGARPPRNTPLEHAQRALGGQYRLDTYRRDANPSAFDAVEQISQTWQCGAYMVGPTGTGKTHLAKALIFAALEGGRSARYVHAAILAGLFSRSLGFDGTAEEARAELGRLKSSKVVVIDDLGSQRKMESGVFEEQLQLFLDEYRGTLIVTTNLGGPEMQQVVGAKNLSRLAERCAKVAFQGKDQRGRPQIAAVGQDQTPPEGTIS